MENDALVYKTAETQESGGAVCVNCSLALFCFRNSAEKLCVSWVLSLVECVAVWALKLPVVSAPLRSLHNRSPPDFLQLIPTYSKPTRHKVFLRNYWNTKELAANICHNLIISHSALLLFIHTHIFNETNSTFFP